MVNLFCRICRYEHEEPQWGPDGQCPLFEICPCCGAESGYEDGTAPAIQAYCKAWLAQGAAWFSPMYRPAHWDLARQLESVPAEFR